MSNPENHADAAALPSWVAPLGGTAAQIGRAFYRQGMALAARQLQACSEHVARLADCNSPVELAVAQADLVRTLARNSLEEGHLILAEVRQGMAQVGAPILAGDPAAAMAQSPSSKPTNTAASSTDLRRETTGLAGKSSSG
ncbi:hypothetical protein [Zavarzinia sp. CC-PAN008]|uniref:hypothetical protein n=1 Tax=Zavarzinia sp. CC-PAN008 TaxID=3243332 RepID=UPI003F749AF6